MTRDPGVGLAALLRDFPGAVLEVSREGEVLTTNGKLEQALDRSLVGRRLVEVLDRASSQEKWDRILAGPEHDGGVVWELILREGAALSEPRAFSVLREPGSDTLWLVEHPRDPRMDDLSREVTEINSELARTQRELSKERARLARILEELELRQAELEQRNRDLDQFAYVASHDLKAPLRSVAGYAHWLEHDLKDKLEGETRLYLERLRSSVGHMEGMINGILRYSRAGRLEGPVEPVDVGELLGEVLNLLQPPPEVRIEVDPEMPELTTDRLQLEQVFMNLIGNAIKHTRRPDPVVRVTAREAGELYEFRVADNGPGIPERLQERIWTIFFTGESGREADSTGIGLAVVRKLVERQGGRTWVESEPGEGSTFFFLWPRTSRAGS